MSTYDEKKFSYTTIQSANSLKEWYSRVTRNFMFFQFLYGISLVECYVASRTNYEQYGRIGWIFGL